MFTSEGLPVLSDEFVASLLSNWVNYRAVVRLDSACCSATTRATFLRVVKRTRVAGYTAESKARHSWNWFNQRGAQISAFRISEANNADLTFLQEHGEDLEELDWGGSCSLAFSVQLCNWVQSLPRGPLSITISRLRMKGAYPSGCLLSPNDRPVHTDELIPLFCAAQNLRTLTVRGSNVSVKCLPHLPSTLRSLIFSEAARVHQEECQDSDLVHIFHKLANLTHLELDTHALSGLTIFSLILYCKKLEVVSLTYDVRAPPDMWLSLFQGNPHLREVTLVDCKHVTDAHLANLHNLTYLYLGWCHQITNEGMQDVVRNNPNLRTLELFGCAAVTYDVLSVLDEAHALTSLTLSYEFDRGSQERVAQLLARMETMLHRTYPQLQHVELA